jgi:hypothetical protein
MRERQLNCRGLVAGGLMVALLVACGPAPGTTPSESPQPTAAASAPIATAEPSTAPGDPSPVIPSADPTGCGWGPASPTPGPDVVLVWFTCAGPFDPAQPGVGQTGRLVDADATLEERMAAALRALLAGPTETERAAGLTSWFSEATAGALLSVSVDDGLATIDFGDFSAVIPNASTSAGSAMLISELNATMFQFIEVEGFLYRFDGDCDAFWNWLQAACTVQTRG